MQKEKGVWILIDPHNNELRSGSLELVCEGCRIARKMEQETTVVTLGQIEREQANLIAQYGAGRILSIEHPALSQNDIEAHSHILTDVIQDQLPGVILSGEYMIDLVSRIAARLQTGLVTFCDKVDVNEENVLLQTKSVFGNKAAAIFVCSNARPQIATICTETLELGSPDSTRSADVVNMLASTIVEKSHVKSIGFVHGNPGTIDITEADVIVDGGKGLGSPEGFKMVEELAKVIGGTVGATRMVIDKGWCNVDRQIGTTGKAVKPKLVIACGVSGSPQHVMGMRYAETIIAINTDRNAPIFRIADYSIVADALELLPALVTGISRISAEKSGQTAGEKKTGTQDSVNKAGDAQ